MISEKCKKSNSYIFENSHIISTSTSNSNLGFHFLAHRANGLDTLEVPFRGTISLLSNEKLTTKTLRSVFPILFNIL